MAEDQVGGWVRYGEVVALIPHTPPHATPHTPYTLPHATPRTPPTRQVGNDEVVALFTAAESRIHNREWQLEQLDALGKRTECAQGCGYATRADKIEFHEVSTSTSKCLCMFYY